MINLILAALLLLFNCPVVVVYVEPVTLSSILWGTLLLYLPVGGDQAPCVLYAQCPYKSNLSK